MSSRHCRGRPVCLVTTPIHRSFSYDKLKPQSRMRNKSRAIRRLRGGPMHFRATILLAPLLLAACAVAKPTHLPDGRQGVSISCDGEMQGMAACYEKAGELCGARGYDIVNKEQQSTPTGYASVGRYGGFAASGSNDTRSILIACKK